MVHQIGSRLVSKNMLWSPMTAMLDDSVSFGSVYPSYPLRAPKFSMRSSLDEIRYLVVRISWMNFFFLLVMSCWAGIFAGQCCKVQESPHEILPLVCAWCISRISF